MKFGDRRSIYSFSAKGELMNKRLLAFFIAAAVYRLRFGLVRLFHRRRFAGAALTAAKIRPGTKTADV